MCCIADIPEGIPVVIYSGNKSYTGLVERNYGSSIVLSDLNSEILTCINIGKIDRFEIHGKLNIDFFRSNMKSRMPHLLLGNPIPQGTSNDGKS